ncbi:MAG: DUF3472 domain-containing protein [Bacteroidetes bacterium]|nr:MAG: DUF3472 domain-containing protein [Bacteroidota bacterium]
MKISNIWIFVLITLMLTTVSCKEKEDQPQPIPNMGLKIPTEGNSWFFMNPGTQSEQVMNPGSTSWTNPQLVHRTFFRLQRAGEIHIGINGRVESGSSVLKATFGGETIELEISAQSFEEHYIGTFEIPEPGYYYLDIQGISKESLDFAIISDVLLGGSSASGTVHYINEDYYYWGRRGPSVHLGYEVPAQASEVHYFYSEVTVPEGNDVIGSYYMANGFGQGYFGYQVNSETERRVLFSVWSPYETDNPDEIPEDQRIELLRKGNDVIVNDFGNEGSGGQSYLRYNWEAGKTYRFLLKGEPSSQAPGKTDYTAWFAPAEGGEWLLIASWRRPLISTYLTNIYSFLENFVTRTGPLVREAYYDNQWILDTSGNWHELTRARFTADATARDKARLDYAGGLASDNMGFFMKNCGFFNETTTIDTWFTRPAKGQQPDIDLELLP